jgi:hypothetical protein
MDFRIAFVRLYLSLRRFYYRLDMLMQVKKEETRVLSNDYFKDGE